MNSHRLTLIFEDINFSHRRENLSTYSIWLYPIPPNFLSYEEIFSLFWTDTITNRVEYFNRFQFKPTQRFSEISQTLLLCGYPKFLIIFSILQRYMNGFSTKNQYLVSWSPTQCQVLHNHFVVQTFLNFLFLYISFVFFINKFVRKYTEQQTFSCRPSVYCRLAEIYAALR
jgi:hypothetical protein